jgi:hypothetical protein
MGCFHDIHGVFLKESDILKSISTLFPPLILSPEKLPTQAAVVDHIEIKLDCHQLSRIDVPMSGGGLQQNRIGQYTESNNRERSCGCCTHGTDMKCSLYKIRHSS